MPEKLNKEQLAALKEGDEVVVHSWGGFNSIYSVEKVTRVTKTQITTTRGKWRRDTGHTVPFDYNCTAMCDMPASKARAINRRRNLFRRVQDEMAKRRHIDDLAQITDEMLEAFLLALAPPQPPTEAGRDGE